MALSDVKIRDVKAGEKAQKLFDGNGLFLLVAPKGKRAKVSKAWRLKYRFGGKEKLLACGTYPETTLSEARVKAQDARQLLAKGIDPGEVRKAEKLAGAERDGNTFEAVSRKWHEEFFHTWSQEHAESLLRSLEKNIYPYIGTRPITEIKPPELLAVIRRITARGSVETAHRVLCTCGQIFRYAVATGIAERDTAADLKGAIPPPADPKHFSAITKPQELAGLLRSIDGYHGSIVIRNALKFGALTAARPGVLRTAEWSEIDFDAEQWDIPAERMKMKEPLIVPLSRQALEILKELKPITGASKYVFPNGRTFSRPLSENGGRSALLAMGYQEHHSIHGWRATFRTIGDEVLQFRPDLLECQLAHSVRDVNGRSYNRTSHLSERRVMMQTWADYLDGLKAGAKVIPFKKAMGE
jgi:integrase